MHNQFVFFVGVGGFGGGTGTGSGLGIGGGIPGRGVGLTTGGGPGAGFGTAGTPGSGVGTGGGPSGFGPGSVGGNNRKIDLSVGLKNKQRQDKTLKYQSTV